MLKLTIYEDENRAIYVSAKSIHAIYRGPADKGTYVEQSNGIVHWICEKPEQIMAMPEMQALLDGDKFVTLLPGTNILATHS